MKSRFLMLVLLVTFTTSLSSQIDTTNLRGKFLFGLGTSSSFSYTEDSPERYFQYIFHPRAGYFASSRFMPFIGFNYARASSTFTENFQGSALYSLSPGIRYYFTKKNLLFLETGIQYGHTKVFEPEMKVFNFFQVGYGIGINWFMAQGIGNGKFSLEILFRLNSDLIDRPNNTNINVYSTISYLGTGIGLNYIIPFKSSVTNSISVYSPEHVQSFHIIKMDTPNSWSYSYEKAIGVKTVINFELSAKEILGLFSEDVYFVPQIKIEPRYYYGYNKRRSRGQNVTNNSSDYLSGELSFGKLWVKENVANYWQINLIPKWGLRRSFSRHFIFEGAVGPKISYNIEKKYRIEPFFETRIGYVF